MIARAKEKLGGDFLSHTLACRSIGDEGPPLHLSSEFAMGSAAKLLLYNYQMLLTLQRDNLLTKKLGQKKALDNL
jgi:hypothetical protein